MGNKEKAKAYDEVIERTNKSYDNEITEKIFPELKENKDERIKKAIIEFFESEDDNTTYSLVRKKDIIDWLEKQGKEEYTLKSFKDEDVRKFMQYIEKQAKAYEFNLPNRSYDIYAFEKDLLVWLEKQGKQAPSQTNERAWLYLVSDVLTWKDGIGQYLDDPRVQEFTKRLCNYYAQKLYNPLVLSNSSNIGKDEQKSDDKIESKFHKGDWITIDKPCQIINIHDNGNYIVQYCDDEKTHELSKNFCESYFHFWTIQDARDGDVLFFYSEYKSHKMTQVGIIEKYVGKHGGCSNTFKIYVGVNWDNNLQIGKYMGCSNIHPATKEQYDALMKAMNDAGYKWNTETKTLEKQVEPKFKVGDKIVDVFMKYMDTPGSQFIISKITDDKYIFTDGSYISISSQDSWELVPDKKSKFDPKTLQPFDKVLVRNFHVSIWQCGIFSHQHFHQYFVYNDTYKFCIPYNEETKHLVGTTDEAPDYYRYWED